MSISNPSKTANSPVTFLDLNADSIGRRGEILKGELTKIDLDLGELKRKRAELMSDSVHHPDAPGVRPHQALEDRNKEICQELKRGAEKLGLAEFEINHAIGLGAVPDFMHLANLVQIINHDKFDPSLVTAINDSVREFLGNLVTILTTAVSQVKYADEKNQTNYAQTLLTKGIKFGDMSFKVAFPDFDYVSLKLILEDEKNNAIVIDQDEDSKLQIDLVKGVVDKGSAYFAYDPTNVVLSYNEYKRIFNNKDDFPKDFSCGLFAKALNFQWLMVTATKVS